MQLHLTPSLKKRVPDRYEVYDCHLHTSAEKLKCFLRRVNAFPRKSFFLINVQILHTEDQELVFNFISKPDISCNLHCIQSSETMLHISPWVDSKSWNDETIQAERKQFENWVSSQVINGHRFGDIVVVSSPHCGSGKTKLILERLSKMKEENPDALVAKIVIHEKSTLKRIVDRLRTIFQCESKVNAIYFSLMTPLDSQNEQTEQLLQSLNCIFQSLLLHKAVYEPDTQKTFYCGPGIWNIYVETVSDNCISIELLKDVMLAKLPILACCATFEGPNGEYDIDEKARRVCTYLRAYDNGTIDRKFNSIPTKKQLLFVIDKSGSMGQQMGNGKSALDVAIDNAIRIVDSHLQTEDVSFYSFVRLIAIRIAYYSKLKPKNSFH